jgi:hypothetical protein
MVATAVNTVHKVWPKAAVGLALAINGVWLLGLAYGAYRLIF